MEVDLEQVFRTNGGKGQGSYAQNSVTQKQIITMTKHIIEEAIRNLHNTFPTAKCLAITDLGCSSGPNTLFLIHELANSICKVRQELNNHSPIDIQVFLNDLPGNDFNSIFMEFSSFKKQLKNDLGEGFGRCFIHATPNSFFDRLFETQSLHFVHSSSSLHWLSQVPKGITRSLDKSIYFSSGRSKSVIKAYYQQFQTDFANFLHCRSEELVTGGCMVITLAGRSNDPSIKGTGYIWKPLNLTLNQMVFEGLIEEEKVDMFNLPMYDASPSEIEIEVMNEGSFVINEMQVSEFEWGAMALCTIDDNTKGRHLASMVRSVVESMLANHFGQDLMDEVFRRYGHALDDCMLKEKCFYTNVTISLTKII